MIDTLRLAVLLAALAAVWLGIGFWLGHSQAERSAESRIVELRSSNTRCARSDVARAAAVAELTRKVQTVRAGRALLWSLSRSALKARDLEIARLRASSNP